jgi:hypothetical protein
MPAPVPIRLNSPGSSSRGLGSSFRVRSRSSPVGYPKISDNLPCDLCPLRDTSSWSPLTGEHPRLTYVPTSAFLTLSPACSSSNRAGLFHPTATYRTCTSGVFPATWPLRLVTACVPSCPSPRLPVPGRTRPLQSTRRRLQGIDPDGDPLLPTECLALPAPDPLLRFHLPRGCLRTPWKRLRVSSAHGLGDWVLRVHPDADLQRINRCPTYLGVPIEAFPFELCGLPPCRRSDPLEWARLVERSIATAEQSRVSAAHVPAFAQP